MHIILLVLVNECFVAYKKSEIIKHICKN
jgi:hypothetical protein